MHTMQIMQLMHNNTTETTEYIPIFSLSNAHHHIRNESTLIHTYGYSLIITFIIFCTEQKLRRNRYYENSSSEEERILLDANDRISLHSSKWRK